MLHTRAVATTRFVDPQAMLWTIGHTGYKPKAMVQATAVLQAIACRPQTML